MTVIAKLKDGRLIDRTALTATGRSDAGEIAMTPVQITALKTVEFVLSVNLTTANTPGGNGAGVSPHGGVATDNTVGISVYAASGATVGGDIFTLGF